MGKIYCIMGKSSSGKDTIFKMLLQEKALQLKTMIPYTTRPIRDGEQNGVEYFFCSQKEVEEFEKAGKIIELRSYHTVHGIWHYFTVDDGQVQLDSHDYLIIGTLESYLKVREYYGRDCVIPIYIEVEDGLRLHRALERERTQENPKYAELCRRFLADSSDFSEEKLQAAGIIEKFENIDLFTTKEKIVSFINSYRAEQEGFC